MLIKSKSKAQLIRDVKNGVVEFRMISDKPYSERAWYCRNFRKPTRVNSEGIYFGKSMIPFPRNIEDFFYSDNLLSIRVNGNYISYDVRHVGKKR